VKSKDPFLRGIPEERMQAVLAIAVVDVPAQLSGLVPVIFGIESLYGLCVPGVNARLI